MTNQTTQKPEGKQSENTQTARRSVAVDQTAALAQAAAERERRNRATLNPNTGWSMMA